MYNENYISNVSDLMVEAIKAGMEYLYQTEKGVLRLKVEGERFLINTEELELEELLLLIRSYYFYEVESIKVIEEDVDYALDYLNIVKGRREALA